MADLNKEYEVKNTAFLVKYADLIKEIALMNNVDLGVGADMLKAVARGNEDYAKGLEFNMEELMNDVTELTYLSEQIYEARNPYSRSEAEQ